MWQSGALAAWPEGSGRLAVQVACVGECGRGPLQATLLSLRTARDAVEVGDTKEENREVRSLVTRCKTKIGFVELVAPMCINPPFVWTHGHDEKDFAVFARVILATNAPEEGITRTEEKALMLKSPPMKSTLCCTI